VEVGVWNGEYEDTEGPWLRLFYPDGSMVLTAVEKERQAKEAAEQEKEAALERANLAEIEIERLRSRLAKLEDQADGQS
jgi:hypothetical protein